MSSRTASAGEKATAMDEEGAKVKKTESSEKIESEKEPEVKEQDNGILKPAAFWTLFR